MKNPFKYFDDEIPASPEYKRFLLFSFMMIPFLMITFGLPYLLKGLYYFAIGDKLKRRKAFLSGTKFWTDYITRKTNAKIVFSNDVQIPEKGAMVFLNHINEFDFAFDSHVIGKPYLANQSIKYAVFAYWWALAMGCLVFDTSKARSIVYSIRKLLKGLENNCFIVYPEGHNSYEENIKPLMKGMIKIAYDNRIPIVLLVKAGVSKLQSNLKDLVVGYRMIGIIEPSNFQSWDELQKFIYESMLKEKTVLDELLLDKKSE